MISGTKISQLSVIDTLQSTDYFPIVRGTGPGATTNRISGLTVNTAALDTVKANFPINYTSNIFTLSSDTVSVFSNQTNIQANTFALTGTQVIEANSLSAALKIVQTGLGNALLVEDSTSPDSTPFVVTSSGNVGIGVIAPSNKLHIHSVSSSTSADAHLILTQQSNLNSSYIATDASGVMRIGSTGSVQVITDTNNSAIVVLTGGEVGIGVTTPNELLTIAGNVSANTVYANISGNSATASQWSAARVIGLSGSILGNTIINGSQDVTVFTTISTGVIIDNNISDTANISDVKLAPIVSDRKVSPTAIDYTGSIPGQVLMSTGSAAIWQSLSSSEFALLPGSITNEMLGNEVVTQEKLATDSITTIKLSAGSVTESKLATDAVTTSIILDGAVTLQKTTATAAAAPNTLMSRDSNGNLSAVEVTADLKGNARTSTALQTPINIALAGDVVGAVTFDGSESVVLTAFSILPQAVSVWAVYSAGANYFDNLSGTYTQGTSLTQSNEIIVTQKISSLQTKEEYSTFLQTGSSIVFETSAATIGQEFTYLTYNLLTGSPLTAVFLNGEIIGGGSFTSIPSGEYIIDSITPGFSSTTISISTTVLQNASGNISFSYNETIVYPPHNFEVGHRVNVAFLTSISLSGDTAVTQTSGLYYVVSVPDATSFVLSSEATTYQSASGDILLYRCLLRDSFGISNITYVDKGRHILNFENRFNDYFFYGFTGSATAPELTGLFTSSIERNLSEDIQDDINLGVRTVLNDGSLKLYDFNRTHALCFGRLFPG
jgi:hypothetical protein